MPPWASSVLDIADATAAPGAVPLFIGGRWQSPAQGETFETLEPATGRLLATVARASGADVELAVAAANAARADWANAPVRERAELVVELGRRVAGAQDRFALLDARDTGSPIGEMRSDAVKGARTLTSMAGLGLEMKGQTFPIDRDSLHYTIREPWGIVGQITAFNHPTLFACARIAPALVAGNCVILKPSGLAPLGALAVAELAADLLPQGVLSVLAGSAGVGEAITRHPEIRRLTFTGSVSTGLAIQRGAVESGAIKTVSLELGGKNPIVIFPDADLDAAAAAVVRGMNFRRVQGQSCGSTSRLLVNDAIHRPLVSRIVELVERIRLGPPTDPATEMGALISREAQRRCLGLVERAASGGGRVVAGGTAPSDDAFREGAYMLPTVIDDVVPDAEIATEEAFGPILAVSSWDTEEEAIRQANSVRYGLTASIWTNDINRAFRTARDLEVGYIWINDVETRYPAVPFGGWKDSGVGLENGLDELLSFTRVKSVNLLVRS